MTSVTLFMTRFSEALGKNPETKDALLILFLRAKAPETWRNLPFELTGMNEEEVAAVQQFVATVFLPPLDLEAVRENVSGEFSPEELRNRIVEETKDLAEITAITRILQLKGSTIEGIKAMLGEQSPFPLLRTLGNLEPKPHFLAQVLDIARMAAKTKSERALVYSYLEKAEIGLMPLRNGAAKLKGAVGESLELQYVKFRGNRDVLIFLSFSPLESLTSFSVTIGNLADLRALPGALSQMENLKTLKIRTVQADNSLSEFKTVVLPVIGTLVHLTSLDLRFCGLEDTPEVREILNNLDRLESVFV